jgi:glutaredoxin
MPPRLTLYTRDRCCLCDEAHAALERVRATRPFELEVRDLDREAPADKLAAYDHEVPVVELDGRKVMKFRVDEARLARLLAAADAG